MEMPETLSRLSMLAGMVVAFRDQLAFRDHHTIHYDGRQTQIPIGPAAQPAPHSLRLCAMALFGRRLALGGRGSRYYRRPKTCTKPAVCTAAKCLPKRAYND